ncbi:hypothetical protein FHETE_11411, partial [Fusarium heterosporum]
MSESSSSITPGSESDVDYTDENGDLVGFVVPSSPPPPELPNKRRRLRRSTNQSVLKIITSSSDLEAPDSFSSYLHNQAGVQGLLKPYGETLDSKIDHITSRLHEIISLLETAKVESKEDPGEMTE